MSYRVNRVFQSRMNRPVSHFDLCTSRILYIVKSGDLLGFIVNVTLYIVYRKEVG